MRAIAVATLCMVWVLTACSLGSDSMSQFKTLPAEGWTKSMPIKFTPEYADSSQTYDIALALRHTNDYMYSNLTVAVDMIDSVKNVVRSSVDFKLSDGYGNWQGSGFGALYQSSVVIAQGVKPQEATSIVVWQAMNNCDVIKDIQDLGIIVTPGK